MTSLAWHASPVSETLAALDTHAAGLTSDEAARRLARFGPNELEPARPASVFSILFDQVTSVVVWLLAAAAVISLLMGDRIEAAASSQTTTLVT